MLIGSFILIISLTFKSNRTRNIYRFGNRLNEKLYI